MYKSSQFRYRGLRSIHHISGIELDGTVMLSNDRDEPHRKAVSASIPLLAGRFRVGIFGGLGTVPNSNNPYDFSLLPIEEPVRSNNNFSMR